MLFAILVFFFFAPVHWTGVRSRFRQELTRWRVPRTITRYCSTHVCGYGVFGALNWATRKRVQNALPTKRRSKRMRCGLLQVPIHPRNAGRGRVYDSNLYVYIYITSPLRVNLLCPCTYNSVTQRTLYYGVCTRAPFSRLITKHNIYLLCRFRREQRTSRRRNDTFL